MKHDPRQESIRDVARHAYEREMERRLHEQQEEYRKSKTTPCQKPRATRRKVRKASVPLGDSFTNDGPCIRMKDLMKRLPPGQVVAPGLRLSLHSNSLTRSERKSQKRLLARGKEECRWMRVPPDAVAHVDTDEMLERLETFALHTASAPPRPSFRPSSGIDFTQHSFRHLVDNVADQNTPSRGYGTAIKPTKRVTQMISQSRCQSAPPKPTHQTQDDINNSNRCSSATPPTELPEPDLPISPMKNTHDSPTYIAKDEAEPTETVQSEHRIHPEDEQGARERKRLELCVEHHGRVYRVGEHPKLPLPLETWVPEENVAGERASELGPARIVPIAQPTVRQLDQKISRISSAKPKHYPTRTTVLGVPTVGEWRYMNTMLRGKLERAQVMLYKADEVVVTPHERRKMPLPHHLAYRTKGGLRNY